MKLDMSIFWELFRTLGIIAMIVIGGILLGILTVVGVLWYLYGLT